MLNATPRRNLLISKRNLVVAPITQKTKMIQTQAYSVDKRWDSQKSPFTLRLSCRNWYAKASGDQDSRSWAVSEGNSPLSTDVHNKARERFVSELGPTSQVGSSIAAEWRGSADLISHRALQLLRFSRHLRKGQLLAAAKTLNLTGREADEIKVRALKKKSITRGRRVSPKGKPTNYVYHVKDFGSLWLEYSYGWSPLIDDMQTALKNLDRPLPDITVKGRATLSRTLRNVKQPAPYLSVENVTWVHKVTMIADVSVSNPNLYRANQQGLTNPVQWLLEGIPFSFVVDWFSNLSQYVSQLTDFAGLNLSQPQTSSLVHYKWGGFLSYPPSKGGYVNLGTKSFDVLTRSPGIPAAKLSFGYEIPNWRRGLNAISLLVQFLKH